MMFSVTVVTALGHPLIPNDSDLYYSHFVAEVYADKSHTVTGLKQLRSHAAGLAVSNLDECETLAGRGGSDGDNGGTAIIIYTSGSTGTPKGNNNNNLLVY